jgi:hypothetical protein
MAEMSVENLRAGLSGEPLPYEVKAAKENGGGGVG